MKKVAFLVAFALLALTLPASAAEVPEAPEAAPVELLEVAPAMTPQQPIEQPDPLFKIVPFCWTVQGTSCTAVGSTKRCTDVCGSQLSCTCINFGGQRYWNCQIEC